MRSLIPICLPDLEMADAPGYEKVNVGINATLTGWGRQWHNGPLAEQLEMVTLPLISNTVYRFQFFETILRTHL